MSSSNQLDTTTIVLLLLAAIIFLPLLTMGFGGMMGYGGMMGQFDGSGGWWPFVGFLVQLVFLIVLLGGGYLVFRRLTQDQTARNPAMEELRVAYARGDLTEEEFDERRDRLQHD